VVAAPRLGQLLEAAPPLSLQAFGGLPPLPALAVALGSAVRHAALNCGQSARAASTAAAISPSASSSSV
jgi:hypothetical protein